MMEKAKIAMAAMQQAVGSDAAGKQRMLGIYVNLAKSVESQMKSAAPDAKQEMSSVFEAFLQELSAGSSDVGVLNWVAETFFGLAAGLDKGSGVPNRDKVGTVTRSQVEEIAQTKMPDLNAADIEAAMRIIEGTARSMGIEVDG